METLKFIEEKGLEALNTELAISVKKYEEGLIVLNYDQIESPKAHPVVMECRGLILDSDYSIVSRSFDRFFNLGEQPDTQSHLDWNKAICYEKVDGSLIKIYNWKGVWYASTRGTAFAESGVNGFPITFKDLVLKALGYTEEEFQVSCNYWLKPELTYICEVTAMENRVVTRYDGYSLWSLAARHNETGKFVRDDSIYSLGAKKIQSFSFDNVENCIETAKNLKDLNEGYVVYQDGVPICKVKSPAYVAVHHIRSNISSEKALMKVALLGEKEELCLYFPEYNEQIENYLEQWGKLTKEVSDVYIELSGIEDQKTFAIELLKRNQYLSSIAFSARKLSTMPEDILNDMDIERKVSLLEGYIKIG